uniref:Uncharacterized protein n=1 Tax=Rhizophora mucronata TaxID=61149 RepID=A0A2P2R0R2_RHIMU
MINLPCKPSLQIISHEQRVKLRPGSIQAIYKDGSGCQSDGMLLEVM